MKKDIVLKKIPSPLRDHAAPVMLSDETMRERLEKVLGRMKKQGIDQLIVYDDVEHCGNFMYLTGFFTRFEEALLVLNADGSAVLILGNENLNKCAKSRLKAEAVHVSLFSLPNQPHRADCSLRELLVQAGVQPGTRIGLAGWKLFTSPKENNASAFDLPAYIVDALRDIAGENGELVSAADVFIGPDGARLINNANEIAHYEYGAALASDCMLDAMDLLGEGVSELELGSALVREGQHTSVVTIAASGPRFVKANMFPTANRVKKGDPISLTVGYAGGLSSRTGYAVENAQQLPEGAQDYLDAVAIPYFRAYAAWLENIRIGMRGGELYRLIDEVLPRSEYHWGLCPGHLVAEEEWLCSPLYEGSDEQLRSGMILQIDIIPSVPGYAGVGAESTVVLADEKLRAALKQDHPEMYGRMRSRRAYIKEALGIDLPEEVLPMCSTVGYLRPFLLDHASALCCEG